MFFDKNVFHVKKNGFSVDLQAERLRGEVASFDIKDRQGEIIVEAGRRITARHVRLLQDSGLKRLDIPRDYLLDRVTAKDIVDESTGEILLPCNSLITDEVFDRMLELGVSRIETIYTNDLDCGSYVSDISGEATTIGQPGIFVRGTSRHWWNLPDECAPGAARTEGSAATC